MDQTQIKNKSKKQWEIKGENVGVDLQGPIQRSGRTPWTRPDRGRPAHMAGVPLSPALYRIGGGLGHGLRDSPLPHTPPTTLLIEGSARLTGSPPPHRYPSPLPSLDSAGGDPKVVDPLTDHRHRWIRTSPTSTSSPPSAPWRTRPPPPADGLRTLLASLSLSLNFLIVLGPFVTRKEKRWTKIWLDILLVDLKNTTIDEGRRYK